LRFAGWGCVPALSIRTKWGLVATGDPLDADLEGLDSDAVSLKFVDHDIIVVPGFTAGHAEHGVVTLGRGGTDLTAVFFAARLGSKRVRLLKDVDGVYAEDPAENPFAERYGALSYESAAEASVGLIQPKAIEAAKAEGIAIEIAAIGHHEATLIAAVPARKAVPMRFPRLRVALLGCGAVGTGVLACLFQRPDLSRSTRCWCGTRSFGPRATDYPSPDVWRKRWRASPTCSSKSSAARIILRRSCAAR
jgi:homoserine dehydrogenase